MQFEPSKSSTKKNGENHLSYAGEGQQFTLPNSDYIQSKEGVQQFWCLSSQTV